MKGWIPAAILSWVFMGVCNFMAKLAANHLPTTSVAIWWSVGYVPLTAALFLSTGWPKDFHRRSALYSFSAGVVGQLAALAFYVALAAGMVSLVATLSSLYPVLTLLLAVTFLKERMNFRQAAGVGLALVGIVLFCW